MSLDRRVKDAISAIYKLVPRGRISLRFRRGRKQTRHEEVHVSYYVARND